MAHQPSTPEAEPTEFRFCLLTFEYSDPAVAACQDRGPELERRALREGNLMALAGHRHEPDRSLALFRFSSRQPVDEVEHYFIATTNLFLDWLEEDRVDVSPDRVEFSHTPLVSESLDDITIENRTFDIPVIRAIHKQFANITPEDIIGFDGA